MKTTLLSLATALLLATSAFAAPAPSHDDNRRRQETTCRDDRNGKDSNYGYDKKHRVTPQEKSRWEAAHKNNRHNDDHR